MCGGTSLTFPTGLAAHEEDWQIPHFFTAFQMSSLILRPKHRLPCFQHALLHTLVSFMDLFQHFPM